MTHTVTIKTSATQWGVGHGGFHTQRVDFMISDHRLGCVNFVYDCGTLSSPRNLQPWITQFVKELEDARTRKLDAVTISHFDLDHVSGLVELSKQLRNAGISVDRVIAPTLGTLDALLILANLGSSAPKWYRELLFDPISKLHELFGVEPVILDDDTSEVTLGFPIKDRTGEIGGIILSEDGETLTGSGQLVWNLIPYAFPPAERVRKEVAQALSERMGIDPSSLDQQSVFEKLCDSKETLAEIRKIHSEFLGRTGVNGTSVMLWSGPSRMGKSNSTERALGLQVGSMWDRVALFGATVSWLGTGDARCAGAALSNVVAAYGRDRLKSVGVLGAPHHGSSYNVDEEFWRLFSASTLVTLHAQDRYGHPHKTTVTQIGQAGLTPIIVNQVAGPLKFSASHSIDIDYPKIQGSRLE